jgi:alpha-tubulin suppressor-like RCC1 family protein
MSNNTIIIKNGALYGTGTNAYGQLGVGNFNTAYYNTLQQLLPGDASGCQPKYIAGSYYSTIALMTDGTLYGIGNNGGNTYGNGTFGLGPTADTSYNTLKQIPNNTGKIPKYIAVNSFATVVLMTTGEIYGTGYNYSGNLGIELNDTTTRTSLTQMQPISGKKPKYIALGSLCTIVLMTDGTIYGTGANQSGQLGIGLNDTTQRTTLTQMQPIAGKTPKYIACSNTSTIVLMTDGTIYGTGQNQYGQLGIGLNDTTTRTTLTQMQPIAGKTPKYIASGPTFFTIVLMTDGTIYGCGYNTYGQLGIALNDTTRRTTLTQMQPIAGKTPKYIACTNSSTMVLMDDGTVYGTGDNTQGQLGIGNFTNKITTLTPMLNATNVTYIGDMMDYTDPPCFKTDTKILTAHGYVPIQELKKGDLVQTLLNGFQPIELLGYSTIYNPGITDDRSSDQLYVCTTAQYPEIFEDLVLTGAHAILVDNFTDAGQRAETEKVLKKIYVTNGKLRLPACVDPRAALYEPVGTYTVYHLALAHENYYFNYGIYANGLLVETCSLRYLKECSGMTFIE